ncbi:MAG: response regulator [Magnetococcales bacterium]|nr:response regulator [Magnetococcales bacterium]
MKILIVDDLFENRKLLRDLLAHEEACDMVSNGTDALELFEAAIFEDSPYDLVLLDIMMPGMDGQEVLKEIRTREASYDLSGENEAVIIMVTAASSPRDVLDAFFKGGCTDYIEKPFSKETLFGKLRECRLM